MMKNRSLMALIFLLLFSVVIFFPATIHNANAEIIFNDNVNFEDNVYLSTDCNASINYPDGTRQTSAAIPPWYNKMNTGRFKLVLDAEAVLDLETGLVWQKISDYSNRRNWYEALDYCSNLEIGGRKGWRLPTVDELETLVDSTHNPALPEGHPFTGNELSSRYWSSTPCANNTDFAWQVSFSSGHVSNGDKSNGSYYVRAVRSGQ